MFDKRAVSLHCFLTSLTLLWFQWWMDLYLDLWNISSAMLNITDRHSSCWVSVVRMFARKVCSKTADKRGRWSIDARWFRCERSFDFAATDVVTVYVFQEPSLLSSLQDKGLTDVVLQALLVKDVRMQFSVRSFCQDVSSNICLVRKGRTTYFLGSSGAGYERGSGFLTKRLQCALSQHQRIASFRGM